MTGRYELEDRMERFAVQVKLFVRSVPASDEKRIYGNQLLRCSSSTAANYLEAIEAVSVREKRHRFGISRRECKETKLFLKLLEQSGGDESARIHLVGEAEELMRILGSIIQKLPG